jgi:predicted acyl esterase
MRWYDKYLAGIEPTIQDPPFAIQSVTTGRWRAETEWPPADAQAYTTDLNPGTYTDDAKSAGTTGALGNGPTNTGVWTVSNELPYDVHMAGSATIRVDVSSATPRSNLVVDVYDLDKTGKGPLVGRQGSLIRQNGRVTLKLMSADWRFAAGHRIGVRVTDNNFEWWIAAIPTMQTVTVTGGSATFPFLTYNRTKSIEGKSGTTRAAWLAKTATAPAAAVTASKAFNLPPALAPLPEAMATQLGSYK